MGDVGSLAIGGALAGLAIMSRVTVGIRSWIIAGLCVVAGLGIFYADWLS